MISTNNWSSVERKQFDEVIQYRKSSIHKLTRNTSQLFSYEEKSLNEYDE